MSGPALLTTDRPRLLGQFYEILQRLENRCGGSRCLRDCSGRSGWPQRGVYFFFEPGEVREEGGLRVVRVGTHALTSKSRTTLWNRLAQHRGHLGGSQPGGGNHRGSVFRRHVGRALLRRDANAYPDAVHKTWGVGGAAARQIRGPEYQLEQAVSSYIRAMPFVWLEVPDAPGPASLRAYIEANAIGLLSNRGREPVDPPSSSWLGRHADADAIRESGLWNVNHVDRECDPDFLNPFAKLTDGRG